MRIDATLSEEEATVSSQPLLTASEAARALGISLDTLRRWDRAGRIRTQRDSANRRLVPTSEVTRLQVEGFLARVELDVTSPARVVAIITREATEELGLEPGQEAVAVVKSTSVMVER
jgi:molybdopterin-binding protein